VIYLTANDPLQDTLDILSDNWNSGSTDEKTPLFKKITEVKRYDFNENPSIVATHRAIPEFQPAGIGDVDKHEFENFNLDIRTLGSDQETHWLNVIKEIKRIFKSKKVNPLPVKYPETHILEWNGAGQDLSDKTHHLWRKLIPVQFQRYKVVRR